MTTNQTNDDWQKGDFDFSGHQEGDVFTLRINLNSVAQKMGAPLADPMFPVVAVLMVAAQKAGESCQDRREAQSMANRFAKRLKTSILAHFETKWVTDALVAKRSKG